MHHHCLLSSLHPFGGASIIGIHHIKFLSRYNNNSSPVATHLPSCTCLPSLLSCRLLHTPPHPHAPGNCATLWLACLCKKIPCGFSFRYINFNVISTILQFLINTSLHDCFIWSATCVYIYIYIYEDQLLKLSDPFL